MLLFQHMRIFGIGSSPFRPSDASITYLSSRGRSSIPQPCWFLGNPRLRQELRRRSLISLLDSPGSLDNSRHNPPDTTGVAMDVPDFAI